MAYSRRENANSREVLPYLEKFWTLYEEILDPFWRKTPFLNMPSSRIFTVTIT